MDPKAPDQTTPPPSPVSNLKDNTNWKKFALPVTIVIILLSFTTFLIFNDISNQSSENTVTTVTQPTPTTSVTDIKITGLYELGDSVVVTTSTDAYAIFYSWLRPDSRTESYLPYGQTFYSNEHDTIIRKGMGYQIAVYKEKVGDGASSDSYIFSGNRSIIDNPLCPYTKFVANLCDLENLNEDEGISSSAVSFAKIDGRTYLRYKGEIYDESDQFNMTPVEMNNIDSHTWQHLIESPIKTQAGSFMTDEVFGFKVLPDYQSFLFIMRWDNTSQGSNIAGQDFKVFHYDAINNKVSSLASFTEDGTAKEPQVPKINQVSRDGQYIAFNMFRCWNCGGSQPDVLLLNINSKEIRRIGKVSYFSWGENGEYDYKEYKVIACSDPNTPGECTEDPNNLPFLTGQF